jgi:hypothetical protein
MSAGGSKGGGTLASPAEDSVPPPGAALEAAIGGMKAVPTRVPGRAVALVIAAAAIFPLVSILRTGLRPDLAALPPGWVAAMGLAWAVAFVAVLLAALLPRRGEVLPDVSRATRFASIAGIGLVLLGLFATVDAPGVTQLPATTWSAFGHYWWHCTLASLKVIGPVLVVGAVMLRRLFPVGGLKAAAAIGAAGGAASGLILHFICPIGGALHVGLAHAGGVAVGALLGMLALSRILRSS